MWAVEAVKEVDGAMFICADHGNAEMLVNYDKAYTLREGGCLADIIPILIQIMGKEQPVEMTDKSLLIQK